MRLQNRVALITGAGSGIGASMARLFSHEGASILAADIDDGGLQTTLHDVSSTGGKAASCRVDVSDGAQVRSMVDECLEQFGRIDILCNNAGIGSTQTAVETPEDVWDRVFAVNARGTFLGCKYVIPHMVANGGGVIINTASVAGLVGLKNRAAYCASKGAIISLTRAVAVDHVQHNVRCNCICPGTVDSPWVKGLLDRAADPEAERANLVARQPLGRLGEPDEMAKAALYLASDDAAFITGTALVIDGGLTMQ
jgi:NAD(P)-dependent dehydrogenase (short-subunit alcohol dehydrogenase family)